MNSTVSGASFEKELSKAASSQSAALVDTLSALTGRIKAGDASAFDIFYDTSKNYVYNNIRGLSSSISDETAQDIMQEVYIKAFSNISSLNDPQGTLKWLKTITMNTTRDYFKRSSVRHESLIKEDEETSFESSVSDSDLMEPIEIPENIVEDSATRKIVADAVMALPERQRMLMSEFYYNGKSVKDIALETGMSESAVKTQLSRTRAQLKDTFLKIEKEQGIRLHSAGIIPFVFFMFYLLTKDRTITQAAGSAVKSAVFDSAAVKSAVKAAAGAAATTAVVVKNNNESEIAAQAESETTEEAAAEATAEVTEETTQETDEINMLSETEINELFSYIAECNDVYSSFSDSGTGLGYILYLDGDGSFSAEYYIQQDAYGKEFVICYFEGRFTNVYEIDDDIYSATVADFAYTYEDGTTYSENDVTYNVINYAYGFTEGDEVIIFLLGTDEDKVSDHAEAIYNYEGSTPYINAFSDDGVLNTPLIYDTQYLKFFS